MGFFSWRTQDTDRSIPSRYSSRDTFTVYMVNPNTGDIYKEDNYEGYGVFGGKSYLDLEEELKDAEYKYPVLVENYEEWAKYKGQEPENCIFQGYFYPSPERETQERIVPLKAKIHFLNERIQEYKEHLQRAKDWKIEGALIENINKHIQEKQAEIDALTERIKQLSNK